MIPQVFPISRRRRVARANIVPIADRQQREVLLLRRIAERPVTPVGESNAPDGGLVALAAALLESDVWFGTAFGGACCGASTQRLLLAIYVAEGQDCDLSLTSLCNSAAFEPAAVTLRWALKLLDDGVLKLVAGADGQRALRVAPAARVELDCWLSRTRNTLSCAAGDFAV